jgi:hypothetical protein
MSTAPLEVRSIEGDQFHERLRKAAERRTTSYLWVPGDTPPFKPALLPLIYGDGRALFTLSTINQRPRYWVIRGDSRWSCGFDGESTDAPDFGELVDDIVTDLEDCFGIGRCGYSGNSLFLSKRERVRDCRCEDCMDARQRARWPMVDDYGGCSWGRMDWPKGFVTVPNPLSWRGNLLAAPANAEHGFSVAPGDLVLEGSADA